ncbi:N-terminal Xaa-Pro-Lys N-methyltransferase 1 [Chelonus insularis]|uniref:N-terminal Xaa-Pro-Lys N-methyltransferase 1 n=1 Tax=Chelonus insularis TaxID=460826 RepID=UPI00158A94E5|nr:N-terminal Xaa-Pro-Lys N-methyltransferase 1 [Chelonus insularis]
MDDDISNESESTNNSKEFYNNAIKYWNEIPATLDGMLGGFGFISNTDINGSQKFLKSLFKIKNPPAKTYALDCGSGIGRITKELLIKHFKYVDLVEQNSKFLDTAKNLLSDYSTRIGQYYPQGLQDFNPVSKKYDIIWCQWVLGHLEDNDLIQFFIKCINALSDNGILIVKENITTSDTIEVDSKDSSVTRSYENIKSIFKSAGLICIKEQKQLHLPRGLYPVYMFALRSAEIPIES